jgi:hypothetical protein
MKAHRIERQFAVFTLLAPLGIVAVHLTVAMVRRFIPELPFAAWPVTFGAIALAALAAPRCADRLPDWLDGSARMHRIKAVLFTAAAGLAIVQTARITTHRADPDSSYSILTSNEFWSKHECGTAYFHASELHDHGEKNIYHADHYPVLNRALEPQTGIEGMKVEDAYQYPPQFLLLPKTILAFTTHYPTIRMLWFSLQFIGAAAVFLLLARWVGGTSGRWMALLAPLVIVSPAALYAYQYTQFHFAAVVLAVAGMMAFEKNRNALGGALLAFAILGKIFPGFLVILLLAEKRWNPLLWTLAFGVFYTLAALAVLGLAPFSAFFSYHLPRLQSFSAFAFLETWPEVRFELITANLSPYGQVVKLGEMGVPGMTARFASAFNNLFTLTLIVTIIAAARHLTSRERRAQIWLAILGLASMASPAAWGDYIPLPAMWLLTILAARMGKNRLQAISAGTCWIFFYFLLGLVPLGSFPAPNITYALSTVSFLLLVGLLGWTAWRSPATEADEVRVQIP